MHGIDTQRLRSKGWSEKEIQHATGIFQNAEEHKHPHVRIGEHIGLWMLVLLLVTGSAGVALFITPIFLFLSVFASVPLSFLLGVCAGMLLAYALHSLRIERHHHQRAAIVLFTCAFLVMLFTVQALARKFVIIPGVQPHSGLLVVIPFIVGMILPYVIDRRLHGAS